MIVLPNTLTTFFGIVRRDGEPPQGELLDRMEAALAHLPRDRESRWRDESAAFVALEWHAGELPAAPAIHLDAQTMTCTVLAGRLDELTPTDREGDCAQLAWVLRTRGLASGAPLAGDIAFASWEPQQRRLLCGRDRTGLVPLYYSISPRQVLVSTDPAALLAAGVAAEPDEVTVASQLLGQAPPPGRTLYRQLKRLPPGHHLVVERGRDQIGRHDGYDFELRLRDDGDAALAARFRGAFIEAVRTRTASHAPLCVDLSGGLDSSSVVVVTDLLERQGRLGSPAWEAYSLVFPKMGCDESDYIDAVLGQVNRRGVRCPPTLDCDSARNAQRYRDLPDYPNGFMANDLYLRARERGCRVVLGGCGGDEWLSPVAASLADDLGSGRLAQVVRQSTDMAGWSPGRLVPHLLRHALGPWLPPTLRQHVRHRRLRPSPLPWLRPELLRRTGALERALDGSRRLPGATHAQRAMVHLFEAGWVFHSFEMEARAARCLGLEIRYPFLDRQLVDLCLALPEEQRQRRGVSKWVLRQALAGLLPDRVRYRRDKAYFDDVYRAVLDRVTPPRSWRIAERGWVDPTALDRAWVTAASSRQPTELHALWCAFALETWARAVDA